MKRFTMLIALLAMMTVLMSGLTACGGSNSGGGDSGNAVSGNWYVVDSSDVTTLKLDSNGGGSLGGDTVSYELADDEESVTLTIDGESFDLEIEDDDEFGLVLEDGDDIFAYRDKDIAKEVAAGGSGSDGDYTDAILGIWYMPDSGAMETLDFSADGTVSLSGATTIDYRIEGDTVTLVAGDDSTYDLIITEDAAEGWVLKETYGDIAAWKDKAKAEANLGATETPAATTGGKTEADYIGSWTGESFSYAGMDMSLSDAEMTFSIEFKSDGTAVAMTNGESDGSATWTLNSDGTVTLTDGTGTLPENSYIDDSGVLHLALDADDGTMWILCKK